MIQMVWEEILFAVDYERDWAADSAGCVSEDVEHDNSNELEKFQMFALVNMKKPGADAHKVAVYVERNTFDQ